MSQVAAVIDCEIPQGIVNVFTFSQLMTATNFEGFSLKENTESCFRFHTHILKKQTTLVSMSQVQAVSTCAGC